MFKKSDSYSERCYPCNLMIANYNNNWRKGIHVQSLLFYPLQLAAWNNVHVLYIYHSTHNENTFTLSRAIQNRQSLTGLINLYFACHTYHICFVYVCNADVFIK